MAVLRCRNLPSFVTWEIPDVEALFSDDALLLDALAQSGSMPITWCGAIPRSTGMRTTWR